MSLGEIITGGGVAGIIVILSLIQVAPLKVNPWSAIARGLGHALNADLSDKIDQNEAQAARYRIIRFDDEIRHKTRHTEEHFNQILDDINQYERYCSAHPDYPNLKAGMAIDNIKEIYRNCKNNNDFLI
ncbi:MAG: hypothetical protein LUD72_11375 [Bacteroidales bacterium]|nr:hypothetical protein [Bacteroidales bacterium]